MPFAHGILLTPEPGLFLSLLGSFFLLPKLCYSLGRWALPDQQHDGEPVHPERQPQQHPRRRRSQERGESSAGLERAQAPQEDRPVLRKHGFAQR